MDQQPKIPTLKDAQKPQVKIKGMGAGLTIFDRLKQFKKKDLAFILAGLGTLFMAPLAEHFMMAPENGDAALQQGWGGKGGAGSNFFGSGSSPYESGSHLASGGAIGGAGDIITPLNVRDPSSLVMGPGSSQQPPAGSAAPAAPPPTASSRNDEDYKDALKGAASRAASAAVKKAPLPVPKIAFSGSGLRGLGVAGGGSSASASSLPVGPAAGSTGVGGGSGLNMVRNTPGFRGAAGARSPTGGTGLDGTKKAGAAAGDAFNRAGNAAAGLNEAANAVIPTGGLGYGGGGHGGVGPNDKPYSGSGPGGSKSIGESLAFLRAKQRQEEELKLEFEKKKLKDNELLLYGIRNDAAKAAGAKIAEGLTKWGMCKGLSMGCPAADEDFSCSPSGRTQNTAQIQAALCTAGSAGKDGGEGTLGRSGNCFKPSGSGYIFVGTNGTDLLDTCLPSGKKDAAGPQNARGGAPPPAGIGGSIGEEGATLVAGLNELCKQADKLLNPEEKAAVEPDPNVVKFRVAATQLVVFSDAMFGKTADCGGALKDTEVANLSVSGDALKAMQIKALDSVPTLADKLFKDIEAKAQGNYDSAIKTGSTSPGLLAGESKVVLDGIVKYAGNITDPRSLKVPTEGVLPSKSAENNKLYEAHRKVMLDSKAKFDEYLVRAKDAQAMLNGQPAEGAPSILTQLDQIAGKEGTLLIVQGANKDYAPKEKAIDEVLAKAPPVVVDEGSAVKIPSPKAQAAVKEGADAAVKSIGGFTPATPVPPEKIDGKPNEAYETYRKAAEAAKKDLISARVAEKEWLMEVSDASTKAKDTLLAPPKKP